MTKKITPPKITEGEVKGPGVGPYLGLDEIGSRSPMMIFIIISYLFNCTFWIFFFFLITRVSGPAYAHLD